MDLDFLTFRNDEASKIHEILMKDKFIDIVDEVKKEFPPKLDEWGEELRNFSHLTDASTFHKNRMLN